MEEDTHTQEGPRMNFPPDKLPTVALAAACRALQVPEIAVRMDGRSQPAAWARQVSWWLLEDVLGWTHGLIAQQAQRDRSAVSHGVATVVDRVTTEPRLAERVALARHLFVRATAVEVQPRMEVAA